jgi:type III secretory pathway component EscU
MFDHELYMFQVLHLPSWFPGMSFKKEMAVARELSKQYVNRPFEYALQNAVMVTSTTYLVRMLNNYMC